LNAHDEYDDDASLSDDGETVAETAFDSPTTDVTGGDGECPVERAPTAGSSQSTRSSSTGVKEPMKLPLDGNDYLQPKSSLPATYLELVTSPGNY